MADVGFGPRKLHLGGNQGGPQFLLLIPHHVERESVRVLQAVGSQTPPLRLDLLDFAVALLDVLPPMGGEQSEAIKQLRFNVGDSLCILRYLPLVVAGHFLLQPIGSKVGQVAAVAPVPTGADEVVVRAAVAGDFGEQQPLAAEGTEDRSLDVVPVTPPFVTAFRSAIEDLLHAVKELI